MNDLETLTQAALTAAKRAGADGADALAIQGTSLSVSVRASALEQVDRSDGIDLGLRVFVGQRQACVSISDIRDETIEQAAQRAVFMAQEAPDDPNARLAMAGELTTDTDVSPLDLFDPSPDPDPQMLEDHARTCETAALAVNGVAQTQSATAAFGKTQVHLATSNGFSAGYQRSDHVLSVTAVAGEGTQMVRDSDHDMRIYQTDLRPATDIGTQAGERTIAALNARKAPQGRFPVLYDERVAQSLISHLVGAINGTALARGATWLPDPLGAEILPKGMDLQENPHRPRTSSARLYDAEGLATTPRDVVTNGTVTGLFLDLSTAAKLNQHSTASARRGTGAPPAPGAGNLTLTQGEQTRDQLIRDMGTGLLVTKLMGSTINPTTGDYSRGASGFWVENGEIQYPVHETTIAGNLRDMLPTLQAANDARTHLSWVIPSLLVDGLTIA